MTLSNSHLAYQDCYDLFQAAYEDAVGIRIKVADGKSAERLRARLNQARVIERTANRRAYEPGHALHGATAYDFLVVQIRNTADGWYVYISRVQPPTQVESLSNTAEPLALPTPTVREIVDEIAPQKTLPPPSSFARRF